jgi:cytochrome bd ubiquinol oxidase subunit I
VLFVLVYGVVFTMGLYYINRLIERGPQEHADEPGGGTPAPSSMAAAPEILAEAARRVPVSSEHPM